MGIAVEPQDAFVAQRKERWHELDMLLMRGKELHRADGETIARVAALYRSLCSDLMRSRAAGYTPDLTGYLNGLTSRAHNALYGARPVRLPALWRLLIADFPRALRDNGRLFWLAAALFFVPAALGLGGALASPEFASEVLPGPILQQMAENYAEGFHEGRQGGLDTMMAGFYVYNNVGIAFRCFATGILFGAGSLFFLVYNGLIIGTVVGYVIHVGHGANILTFVCGHGPFELTAIVISGGAGLQMGFSLVNTEGRTRLGSLRAKAPDIARQVVGAAVMLLIAAGIEAFWSPSSVPRIVKWIVAGVLMLFVTLWLSLGGRRR
ncbi:MAG TPA: stage II sporulation protein M [Polyangiaceae bacterium]|nr:stage II sporulation protein M [Polyangiaceae bacterium]